MPGLELIAVECCGRENDALRQQSSAAEACGAVAPAAPACSVGECAGAGPPEELLQAADQYMLRD